MIPDVVVLPPPKSKQAIIPDFNTDKARIEAQETSTWDLDPTKKKGDQMSWFAWDSPSYTCYKYQ